MQFLPGQDEVLRETFKAFETEETGTLPSTQLFNAVSQITEARVHPGQFKDSVGKTCEELGEVTYSQFVDVVSLYLQSVGVSQLGRLTMPLEGRVGIDSLPTQVKKQALRHSIQFNIMLVGGSGLGKSTLQNTLFKSLLKNTEPRSIVSTVEISSVTHCIEENGTRVLLTVVDTPGFGDQIDNTDTWEPVVNYIRDQYRVYLEEELKAKRKRFVPDRRIHVVLYFIAPTGHSLKALDVATMKAIGRIANVIPIIAKADALTEDERTEFKKRIMEDLTANQVRIFPFPMDDDEEDDLALVSMWRSKMPFAVMGCDDFSAGQLVRRTAWGDIQVENPDHCDLSLLRELLIRSHMTDLIRVTDKFFYEAHRTWAISGVPVDDIDVTPQPSPAIETKRSAPHDELDEDEDDEGSEED